MTYRLRLSEKCHNGKQFLNVTSDAPIWTDDMPSERMRSLAIKALERAKDRADRQSRLHDVDAELLPEFMWDFFWDSAVHIIGDKLREISEKSEQKKKGHKTRREGKVDQKWHDGEPFATKGTRYGARKKVYNELLVQCEKSTVRAVEILTHVLSKIRIEAGKDGHPFDESAALPRSKRKEVTAMSRMMSRASSCVAGMKGRISKDKMGQLTCLGAILLPEKNDPSFRLCCKLLIHDFLVAHNHESPNAEDTIKEEHPQFPSCKRVAQRIYRYETWEQLWAEFKKTNKGIADLIGNPNYPDEPPTLFRSSAPWNMVKGRDSSCLCTNCETTNCALRGKKQALGAMELLLETCVVAPPADDDDDSETSASEFEFSDVGDNETSASESESSVDGDSKTSASESESSDDGDSDGMAVEADEEEADDELTGMLGSVTDWLQGGDDEMKSRHDSSSSDDGENPAETSDSNSTEGDEMKSSDDDSADDNNTNSKSNEELDAEAVPKLLRVRDLLETTNKYDTCVACLPCIGKGGKLEDAKMSCVNGECPKCGMDKIWSKGLRRRLVKREWDAGKKEWVDKLNKDSKLATDVWAKKVQWRDYVTKARPTKVDKSSRKSSADKDSEYDPNAKAARNIVLQTFEGTVIDFLDHIEKQITSHIAHRNLVCTEHRSKKDYDHNSRPWTVHRDQDFAENGSIENFDKLQSEHWQKSQYTLFMAINSFLLVDEWNKTEGSLDEGNEVTVDGELYIKDPGDVHYRPEVNLNSFWACVKSHVRDDIYCVVDEEGIEHEVERRRLRLRKRHTICVAHVSDDMKHDRFAMKTFSIKELEDVESYMRENFPNDIPAGNITHLHLHSDNAATHFKSTGAMESFTSFTTSRGGTLKCKYIWSFGAPGHGKGFFDGMGGVFKNMIHGLIKKTKTSTGGIEGTASGYIESPQDVFDALEYRFSGEQLEARRKKGGKGKKNQVDKYMFLQHIIEADGEIRRPEETFTSLENISSCYQFSVSNEGLVHSRERSCWCIHCTAAMINGSVEWNLSHNVRRCTSRSVGESRGSNAYEFTKRQCAKVTGPSATKTLAARRQSRNDMAKGLGMGDWLVFKSTDDPKQPFWLGRAVSKSDWGGQCIKHNNSNGSKVIEGAMVSKNGYAINVQWYTVKEDGGLEYVIEGGDNAQPFVCSNHSLLLTGINESVNQVTGSRVRVTRRRTVRSNQLEGFDYGMRSNLQTSEEDFFSREYGNIWTLDKLVRDRAMVLVDQVS